MNTNTNTNTNTSTPTREGKTMTNTNTSTAVPVPAGTPKLPWSVKGRGKSATYCAALPAGKGTPGQRVALIAQSGAVTFAVLTEPRETVDNVTRWDFDRDAERMTPAVKAANRAAKAANTAAYWSSDAGKATAARIDQRAATRAAGKGTAADDTSATDDTAAPDDTSDQGTPAPTAANMAAIAQVAEQMTAAGIAADVIAATIAHMMPATPAPAPTAAPDLKVPAAAARAAVKAAGKAAPATSGHDVAERCDACNRDRKGCQQHQGAPDLLVCPRCATLDADTAETRAARHRGK